MNNIITIITIIPKYVPLNDVTSVSSIKIFDQNRLNGVSILPASQLHETLNS